MSEIEQFFISHGIWMKTFEELHNRDSEEAKFKIGEKVKYDGHIYSISGVNVEDENTVEYSLKGYWFLVYEEELEKLEE